MQKLNKRSIISGIHRAKSFIGHTRNTTKNILGNVDNGARLFKTVYGVLSPMIENYGGGGISKHVMKTIRGLSLIHI